MKPSTLSESELESLKSVLRSATGDDVATLHKKIKDKEFEVAFDKRDVERCLAITPLKELSRQWLEGLLNIAQSYNKIRDWRRKQCIVNDIEKAIEKIDNRPMKPSTLSESELESLKSELRSATGDDVATLHKIKDKEFEVAFDKRDV